MCPPEAMELQRLASEAGFEEVRSKEMTLLEVIESASSLPLSLSLFTTYFTIAKVRMYSISSAPSFKEEEGSAGWTASITVGVVDYAKAQLPGKEEERRHLGAASGMLASLSHGDTALGYVAHMMSTFRLDPVAPIIMVSPPSPPLSLSLSCAPLLSLSDQSRLFFFLTLLRLVPAPASPHSGGSSSRGRSWVRPPPPTSSSAAGAGMRTSFTKMSWSR